MAIRQYRQDGPYHAYFRDIDGRMRTISLKTVNRAVAERLERRLMAEVSEKKAEIAFMRRFPDKFQAELSKIKSVLPDAATVEAPTAAPGGLRLSDMWKIAEPRRRLSESHQKCWLTFLSKCGKTYASEITPQVALQYLEQNFSKGNGKTFNNNKAALNTIFRACLVEARLSASPFAAIVNRRVTDINHHRNISDEEFDKIFVLAPKQLQIAMMLSRWTAQRLETVMRMTPAMFDFDRRVFLIDPAKNRRFKEWVCVPLFPELADYLRLVLRQCRDKQRPIVEHFSKWKSDDYTHAFTDHLRAAGIPSRYGAHASFHSLRGSAITWMKENGINGEELRSITGHNSDEVEEIYARDVASVSKIAWRIASDAAMAVKVNDV